MEGALLVDHQVCTSNGVNYDGVRRVGTGVESRTKGVDYSWGAGGGQVSGV